MNKFDSSLAELGTNPLKGSIPPNKTIEKLGWRLVDVQNYFVFYAVKEDRVEIRRIIYGWRTWGKPDKKRPDM